MEERGEELYLTLDPSTDRVVGVFDGIVHIALDDRQVILLIDYSAYLEAWKLWLESKQEYCERLKCYCGIGYLPITKCEKQEQQMDMNIWSESDKDYRVVMYDVYVVLEMDEPEFEHG